MLNIYNYIRKKPIAIDSRVIITYPLKKGD